MKIRLRRFNENDCGFLSRIWPGATYAETLAKIAEWNTLRHDGVYFEMFAVQTDSDLAGYVSLYAKTEIAVSVGAEILPEYRQKGIACRAITEVLRRAKKSGYGKALARVRRDNAASLRLCEKLGLNIVNEDATAKGAAVYSLEKIL